MTQRELAAAININPVVLNRMEKGKRPVKADELSAIADVFGVSTDKLLGKSSANLNEYFSNITKQARIPVLGAIACGEPIDAIEEIIDWAEIPEQWLYSGAEYFGLKVKGDSMEPKISNGDIAIIKKQPFVEDGQLAAVMVGNDEATIKKVKFRKDGIMLIALNTDVYEPHFYSAEEIDTLPVRICGRVVRRISDF